MTPSALALTQSAESSVHAGVSSRRWPISTATIGLAGFLSAFTVSLVGEMPVGEPLVIATAGWAGLCAVMRQAPPGRLFSRPFFWALLAAQALALGAYVASDLYRGSSAHDMARGWGRMVFLGLDLVAIVYLLSCARRNLVAFVVGANLGACASLTLGGPMFGDIWKFGFASPVTFFTVLLAPLGGPWLASAAFAALAAAHLLLDYRSYAALCAIASFIPLVQLCSPRSRLWLAPVGVSLGLIGAWIGYQQISPGTRATRSDVERTAMITAAVEAFTASPLVGHGSWFSNTNVYENFMVLRHEAAKRQRVGGFAHPNQARDSMALHSQILVALAEGGLVGGSFFFVYGLGLIWAFWRVLVVEPWTRAAPLYSFLLLTALWNLGFSPFSGAQRIWISVSCGLVLLLMADATRRKVEEDPA
jgi:hypothetical protein